MKYVTSNELIKSFIRTIIGKQNRDRMPTNPRQRVRNSFRCGLCLFYGCIVLTYLHIVAQAFI